MNIFLRKICMLVSMLICCCSICLAASYPTTGVPTKNTVNVRKSPSTKSNKLGQLKNKEQVKVIGETKDKQGKLWYEVELKNGRHGYVSAEYLSVTTSQSGISSSYASKSQSEQPKTDDIKAITSINSKKSGMYFLKDGVLRSVKGYPSLDPVFNSIDILANCVYFAIFDAVNAGLITKTEERYPKFGSDETYVAKVNDTLIQVCFPISSGQCATVTVDTVLDNEIFAKYNITALDTYKKVYYPKNYQVQIIVPDEILKAVMPK